jgi:hypothetical protein
VQILSTGIFFILASTTLENAYTLSKPELQQCLWMLLSILIVGIQSKSASTLKKTIPVILSAVAVFMACLSKETGIILVPISLGWFLFSWVKKIVSKSPDLPLFQTKGRYLLANSLGVATYIIMRSIYLPFGFIEKGYPSSFNFAISHMKENARIWLDLLSRDFTYLVPLVFLPILWAVLNRKIPRIEFIFDTSLWMLAWILIYIPWVFTQEYYLLPFAAGAALMGSILVRWKSTWRGFYAIPLVLAAILFLLQLPGLYTKARAQLVVDAANDEMMSYVLKNAPQNSVVLINIQDPNEYVGHFKTLVNIIGERPDLYVDYFQFQDPISEGWDDRPIMLVSPIVENQFYPSMRMGVFEMPSRSWNKSLLEYMGDNGERVDQFRHAFRSALVDTPRAICFILPSLKYCKVPHSPLDNRVFAYGWDIYLFSPASR